MRGARPAIPGDTGVASGGAPRRSTVLAVVALAGAGVAVYGARGSLGLFLAPWQEQFGASRGSVALVSTVGFVVFAAAQPLAGRLLETVPGRRLVIAGLALCGAGYVGAAAAQSLMVVVVLIGVVAALGTGLASLPVLSVIAAEAVTGREGLVFGLLTAAAAGGQVIVLPIATAALQISVPTSLLLIAALLAAAAAALMGVAPSGGDAGPTDLNPERTPLRTVFANTRFWQLLIPFFVCGYTTTGLIDTHLIPHAVDHHIHISVASTALATLAAFNVFGVLVAGVLTDRLNRGRMLAALYASRAVVVLLLPVLTTPKLLFLFAALFGLVDFATVPPTTALTRQVFSSTGGWAVALGIISAAHQLGSAAGAFAGGWLFDMFGGYRPAFISAAVVLLAAAAVSLRLQTLDQPQKGAPVFD